MAKGFGISLGTKDSDNVLITEVVQVRAGAPHFDPPQVGFTFPPHVAPQQGAITGPFWPTNQFLGFAFCRVVPSPAADGTGRFFAQTYYNSGNFPNNPNQLFEDTFNSTATTTDSILYSYTINELSVNTGGGTSTSGFAVDTDISGLRHALVITDADLSYVYEGRTGNQEFRIGGDRAGFRNPGTDELIAVYDHDTTVDKLYTLERLEFAYLADNTTRKTWPSNTQIIPHPYHYVPLYRNDGATSLLVQPTVLVIEEGLQFPLTGLFNVNGTSVSGLYTRFLSEIASGTQMAIRFGGTSTWYLVSGVTSNSGLRIYDYGRNPQISSGFAEAVPYAKGSGIITVLPGLSGCASWDIALLPDLRDNDGVATINAVVFTANTVAIIPGGAPSGTLNYVWTIQPLNSGVTTVINSGNSVTVDFSARTPINVQVQVSGTGQPTCIHSDSTGFITLRPSIPAGTWYSNENFYAFGASPNVQYEDINTFQILGSNTDAAAYFHHQKYSFLPHQADINNTWLTSANYISVKKGNIDNWPAQGTFIVAYDQYTTAPVRTRMIYGTYSGKSIAADDQLTGITITGSFLLDESYGITGESVGSAGISSVPADATKTLVYCPVIGTMPFCFVDARASATRLTLKGGFNLDNHIRYGWSATYKKIWIFTPGNAIHFNTIASSDTGGITVVDTLPTTINSTSIVVLAPWDSQLTGSQEQFVPNTYWNLGNIAMLMLSPLVPNQVYTNTPFTMYGIDFTSRVVAGLNARSYPRYTWLPKRGRLVVPRRNRAQSFVISYDNVAENPGLSVTIGSTSYTAGEMGLQFSNCRVVSVNGSPTSGVLNLLEFVVPFKETAFNPVPQIVTKNGTQPNLPVSSPGMASMLLGWNATIVDVIRANYSATNSTLPGNEGTAYVEPNWEKALLSNFPANGIPALDSIYRKKAVVTSTGGGTQSGGGGGGCLVGWTLVTIKHTDGFAKDVPISEVKVGDMIASMDRRTYARKWCEVTDVRSLKTSEAYELITLNGKSIKVTGKHPISTCNERQWTPVEELEVGTWIETEDGPELLSKSIKDTQFLTVYDLTVDDLHTFIAGGILVHNKYKQNV